MLKKKGLRQRRPQTRNSIRQHKNVIFCSFSYVRVVKAIHWGHKVEDKSKEIQDTRSASRTWLMTSWMLPNLLHHGVSERGGLPEQYNETCEPRDALLEGPHLRWNLQTGIFCCGLLGAVSGSGGSPSVANMLQQLGHANWSNSQANKFTSDGSSKTNDHSGVLVNDGAQDKKGEKKELALGVTRFTGRISASCFVYLFEPLQSLVLLSLRMVLGLCALTTVTVKTSANCKLEVQRVQASFMSQFSKFLRRKKVQTNKNTKQKRGNHPKKQHTKRISSQLLVLQRVKGVKQHVVFQTGLLALFWNVEIWQTLQVSNFPSSQRFQS